jgi:hypothetical protein
MFAQALVHEKDRVYASDRWLLAVEFLHAVFASRARYEPATLVVLFPSLV